MILIKNLLTVFLSIYFFIIGSNNVAKSFTQSCEETIVRRGGILQKVECSEVLHVAALILARGGSKGIKLKNLAEVGGVSLLRRSLNVITETELFDSVWVSTDHESIAEEGRRGGAQIHNRSEESASDTATSIFAVQEFLEYHKEIHILALIQCTSPFIKPDYIKQAFSIISQRKECVFSARRSFKLRWGEIDSKILPLNFDLSKRPRRQDWNGELVENGMFYFAITELLLDGRFQDERKLRTLTSLRVEPHLRTKWSRPRDHQDNHPLKRLTNHQQYASDTISVVSLSPQASALEG